MDIGLMNAEHRDGIDAVASLFEYDTSLPLEVQIAGETSVNGIRVQDITFASQGGRVTALIVDAGTESQSATGRPETRAGVIFMHWGQGDRSEFLWEATVFARLGAVSVLLDAPWNRPDPWKGGGEDVSNPGATRAMYVQTIIDLRRAVDLLEARNDVEPRRIAFVGHSFGATWGGVLAGIEHRIATFVLMGGLPSLTDFSPTGARKYDAYRTLLHQRLPDQMLQAYVEALAPLNPETFVGLAPPSSVFMQFATHDSWISRASALRYFEAANSPKSMAWYPTSHEFTDVSAFLDRALWLHRQVGIRPALPLLEEMWRSPARPQDGPPFG